MKITVKNNSLEDTLKEVERLSFQYSKDIGNLKKLDLKSFFKFVSKDIEYKKDPVGYELIMRPKVLLKNKKGDCDDKTVLCLAYFIENNIPCGYSIVSQRPDKEFHHIFPIIKINGKLYDFDATYSHHYFLKEQTGFTKRIDKIIFKGDNMKTVILEGSEMSLQDIQYQLSGGLSGDLHGLKKIAKKATKKVKSVSKVVTTSAGFVKDVADNKVVSALTKELKDISSPMIQKIESQVKEKVKDKLKDLTNVDKLIQLQLKAGAMYTDEFINNVPVVGSVNRGFTTVVGKSPAEIIIVKGGGKVVAYGTDKIKEQSSKIIGKYIPNIIDSDEPKEMQTGEFTKYVFDNPDFITFDKTKDEIIKMHPDIMYNHINKYIANYKGEKLLLPDFNVPADIKKIYYFTAGQPLYNPYNEVIYKTVMNSYKELNKVSENPDTMDNVLNNKESELMKKYTPIVEQQSVDKQTNAPVVKSTGNWLNNVDTELKSSDNKMLIPVIGGILALILLKKMN